MFCFEGCSIILLYLKSNIFSLKVLNFYTLLFLNEINFIQAQKTAHIGGKCEVNNGITPANRGITPVNRQKKTANKGGVCGEIPV